MKAVVNRIIPFSSVDGPGNRTAIFLQGCNINCKYCHNPETRRLCINCAACVGQCPAGALSLGADKRVIWDPDACVQCDTCIHVCPNDSSPKVREMTPEEVYAAVKRQIPFIRGISVSGGECMLWPDFLKALFTLAKEDGLGCLIDSNGTIPLWEYPELLEVSDGVMLDIKAFDDRDHRSITDEGNEIVLKNAVFLAKLGKLEEVRAVIVPDLYDGEKSIQGIGTLLAPYRNIREIRIKLIAYRPMGVREAYSHYQVPTPEFMTRLSDILKKMGFKDIVII